MPVEDPLKPLSDALNVFEDGYDAAYAQADDAQKQMLMQQLTAMRTAYWQARAAAIDANSAAFQGIAADLRTAGQRIKTALRDLQNIALVIETTAEAVRLATAIAGLVAPVPTGAVTRAFGGRRPGRAGRSGRSGRAVGARGAAARGTPTPGAGPLRVLCVHGVGDHHSDTTWQTDWANTIRDAIRRFDAQRNVVFEYVMYDDIFERYPLDALTIAGAVWKLSVSGIVHGIGDLFRRSRGVADISSRVRWTAGMVVQWAQNGDLRDETRKLLAKRIDQTKPHLICAHSLGSLVMYDTLVRDDGPDLAKGRRLMTFGSQIGNPFVRNTFGGRIVPLASDFWYHLFNRNDDVFAHEIRLPPQRFSQIETEFEEEGVGDHSAIEYLKHERAVDRAWQEIASVTGGPALFEPIARTFNARATRTQPTMRAKLRPDRPPRRALLIGINEYPNVEERLEGCVNDVFTISQVLQETGFAPEDIRVVLDERATAAGIKERLKWLLEDVSDDEADERVFYYSGHGTQLPTYGEGDQTDHMDESLVPWDFNWTEKTSLTDDYFFELYSQLPYKARFIAIFDCCHSGGMTRAGGARVRGLAPPDDIRHRSMEWNSELEMWMPRKLPAANKDLEGDKEKKVEYVGESGAVHRLGRAIPLRRLRNEPYDDEREAAGHLGPYMPIIFQACGEGQLSYEYRHGVTSHGAFTYSLARVLRKHRQGGNGISFKQLKDQLTKELAELGYEQTPCLVGPSKLVTEPIPWRVRKATTGGGGGGAGKVMRAGKRALPPVRPRRRGSGKKQ